jgi:hypothetical protein
VRDSLKKSISTITRAGVSHSRLVRKSNECFEENKPLAEPAEPSCWTPVNRGVHVWPSKSAAVELTSRELPSESWTGTRTSPVARRSRSDSMLPLAACFSDRGTNASCEMRVFSPRDDAIKMLAYGSRSSRGTYSDPSTCRHPSAQRTALRHSLI